MKLTDKELQFLQRLIGHHFTGNGCDNLYDKIASHAEFRGVSSDKPLPIERSNYWDKDDKRVSFRLKTQEWFEQ